MTEEKNDDDVFANRPKVNSILHQLKCSIAIAKKDIRIYYNKGPVLNQGILFPIILFIAFVLGRDVEPLYIISGLMAMVSFLMATSIGPVIFPWETRQKTLERLMTCPISLKTLLIGNIWSAFIFGGLFTLIPLILGTSIFGMWGTMKPWIIIPGILIAMFAYSCFSLILSVPATDQPTNLMTLTVLIKFPIIFISPLFTAINVPSYVLISPLTYFIDIINTGFTGVSAFGPYGLLLDFGVLAGFGLLFLFLTIFLHGKTMHKRF